MSVSGRARETAAQKCPSAGKRTSLQTAGAVDRADADGGREHGSESITALARGKLIRGRRSATRHPSCHFHSSASRRRRACVMPRPAASPHAREPPRFGRSTCTSFGQSLPCREGQHSGSILRYETHDRPRRSGAGEPRMGARRMHSRERSRGAALAAGSARGGQRSRADADPVEKAASSTCSPGTAVRGLARRARPSAGSLAGGRQGKADSRGEDRSSSLVFTSRGWLARTRRIALQAAPLRRPRPGPSVGRGRPWSPPPA